MRLSSACLTVGAGLLLALNPLACGGDGAKHFGGDAGSAGAAAGTGGADEPGTGGRIAGSGGMTVGSGGGVEPGSGGVAPGSGGMTAGSGGAVQPGSGGATVATGGRGGTGGITTTSGGAPGAGGTIGTGGRGGTGGITTTSGGAPGAGGMIASGGRGGTGAVIGTGGASSGGAPGTGGANGDKCASIAAAYEAEMTNAKMCDTTGGVLGAACKSPVSAKLGCGSECFTYVDDPKRLNEIAAQWTATGCQPPRCTAIVCQTPTGVKCVARGIALTGMCTDLY